MSQQAKVFTTKFDDPESQKLLTLKVLGKGDSVCHILGAPQASQSPFLLSLRTEVVGLLFFVFALP